MNHGTLTLSLPASRIAAIRQALDEQLVRRHPTANVSLSVDFTDRGKNRTLVDVVAIPRAGVDLRDPVVKVTATSSERRRFVLRYTCNKPCRVTRADLALSLDDLTHTYRRFPTRLTRRGAVDLWVSRRDVRRMNAAVAKARSSAYEVVTAYMSLRIADAYGNTAGDHVVADVR
jgi:hypothetical protein